MDIEAKKPQSTDKVITIIVPQDIDKKGDLGENYLIIDNKLFKWDEGLKYLQERKGFSKEEVEDFIIDMPVENRTWLIETLRQKMTVDEWKKKVLDEYKEGLEKAEEAQGEMKKGMK